MTTDTKKVIISNKTQLEIQPLRIHLHLHFSHTPHHDHILIMLMKLDLESIIMSHGAQTKA
jgi:hypothetical protein